MNLQEEKIALVKVLLDLDDENLLREINALVQGHIKAKEDFSDVNVFYENFRESVREIRQDMEGKGQLKDAKDWLDEV